MKAKDMASHSVDGVVLGIYLSEARIGDEYGCLTEHEFDRAGRWVAMLERRGIKVWEEGPVV